MSEKAGEGKSAFEGLIEELGTLAKGMSAEGGETACDDKAIEAAAKDGEAEGGEDEGKDKEVLGKSFTVALENGDEVEAFDGTELVKALMSRVEKTEADSLAFAKEAVSLIKSQGDLIKSLQGEVGALKSRGVGRKAILAVTEKPALAETLAKSESAEAGMAPEAFLAKCLALQAVGKLTGQDVAMSEARILRGIQPPDHVIQAVVAAG